jgi:hypothetical protein
MQRERMARRRITTTRLRTQTRVQLMLVLLLGESRARDSTPSENLQESFCFVQILKDFTTTKLRTKTRV